MTPQPTRAAGEGGDGLTEDERAAMLRCERLGFRPLHRPRGEGHHTELSPTGDDVERGSALAYFLGKNYSDVSTHSGDRATAVREYGEFFYSKSTAIDEWTRICRALRTHGLKIVTADDDEIARLRARLAAVEGAVDAVLGVYDAAWRSAGGEPRGRMTDAMNALRAARHGPTEHKEKP